MEYYAIVIESLEDVEHEGKPRRSGRYPWGSGKRPYQSGGGPKNETPEQREERKKNVLKSARSAIQVAEFANELTYNELDQALKRIELNRKLDNFVKAERENGIRKINDAMEKVGQINDWTSVGIQSLNNVNAIVDLWNSVKTAKEGDYKKYQQYSQQKQQQGSKKDKNKNK